MWSPHPAATTPATPTSGPPAAISTPHWPRFPRCCWSGWNADRRSDPPGPVQVPAVGDGPGDRYARAALATELARVATAPVGQRNRQLWESTRNLYNLVAAGALDHREVDQGLLEAAERCGLLAEEPRQTRRTLASGRQVGLAHPGRPTPAHQPRTHPPPRHRLRAVGEPPRRGGDGHGRRRPAGRLSVVRGVGACRRQAEPAPTPTTRRKEPAWAATPP